MMIKRNEKKGVNKRTCGATRRGLSFRRLIDYRRPCFRGARWASGNVQRRRCPTGVIVVVNHAGYPSRFLAHYFFLLFSFNSFGSTFVRDFFKRNLPSGEIR